MQLNSSLKSLRLRLNFGHYLSVSRYFVLVHLMPFRELKNYVEFLLVNVIRIRYLAAKLC